ncbi:MAG: AAA family ATPase [Gammaproteobacteria bacterium]
MRQTEALNLLKMGKNVFLTGPAGSGKTYVLNQYIDYLKKHNVKIAVTASTGIAATHLQGTTLHSWAGIGVKDSVSQQDLEKLLKARRIPRHYKKTKVLIIDEISMLHKYQLDMVDRMAREFCDCDQPFGGIQVIVCGDFFQLPPISKTLITEKQFAFEAASWAMGDFYVCYLHEQHRQRNDPLLTVLNEIRNGLAGEQTKVILRTRYKKPPEGSTQATKLYSRNINVDAINARELVQIAGKEKTFVMTTRGPSALVEGLKKSCLALETLKLKIGAEVMFIKNDPSGAYVNGTRGVIIDFDQEGAPVVKTYLNQTIIAAPEEWQYEDNGIVKAILTQVPLRLAWAITIHKSQGMTLDAAEIDLGDAFEPGMGYVALSRVRSLSGLKLMNLNEMALKVHPKILQQDKAFRNDSEKSAEYLKTLSEVELSACHKKILLERFQGSLSDMPRKKVVFFKNEPIPTHIITLNLLKEKNALILIAKKRGFSARTILTHIEKLQGLKLITTADILHLKEGLSEQEFNEIRGALKTSEDGKLKPIFDQFEGKYSYENIQVARLFADIS